MIKTREMKKFKESEFLSDVGGIAWEQMLTKTDDIDALVDHWTGIISFTIDKHAPICEIRVSEKYCPWIDKELKGLMRTRDKLKTSAVKSKSLLITDSYRQVRNKVNALNIRRKKEYYNNKISACKGNFKESWKTINELLNKRSKSSSIDSLAGSGSDTVPKEDIPDVMNSYFSSVGKELADKISATPNALLSGNFKVNKTNAKFHFRTIQVQEIRDAFAKVKTAKSFGVDDISSFFLKLALLSIENSLALLFNTSIETSAFPDLWKIARITPF